jgi:hypothetical protein
MVLGTSCAPDNLQVNHENVVAWNLRAFQQTTTEPLATQVTLS